MALLGFVSVAFNVATAADIVQDYVTVCKLVVVDQLISVVESLIYLFRLLIFRTTVESLSRQI